jgi:transcriptional regulator GlxA family with amidase domain
VFGFLVYRAISFMRKITIGIVLFPRFQMLDIAGPGDAFGEVKVLSGGDHLYEFLTIGTTRGPIQSSSGLTMSPDRTIFDPCPDLDTLIFPGGLGVFDILEDSTLIDWLKSRYKSTRRMCAICNGVFAFGAAGMINGKTVSTHWMDVSLLSRMFPKAVVEADRIYVKDKSLYTTAGVTAGIDLALALIEEDIGRKMALDVAKYLIVHLRRAGGQSQFSPLLDMQGESDSVTGEVQAHILDNLAENHTLTSLAQKMRLSERHLSRVFKQGTGVTPMNFLNDARLDAVRQYLENSDLALREIALRCGFETADNLRRVFTRRFQLSPMEYRQRFHSELPFTI